MITSVIQLMASLTLIVFNPMLHAHVLARILRLGDKARLRPCIDYNIHLPLAQHHQVAQLQINRNQKGSCEGHIKLFTKLATLNVICCMSAYVYTSHQYLEYL